MTAHFMVGGAAPRKVDAEPTPIAGPTPMELAKSWNSPLRVALLQVGQSATVNSLAAAAWATDLLPESS